MDDEDLLDRRWPDAAIYWAQGVLAEMLSISVEEADRRLRAHAERTSRPILDVAKEVVLFGAIIGPADHRH
jgi:AmiR/NasT family two-component response regulator